MRKILFSLMAILLAVGLVGGGAFAYFSDVEKSEGNTFTAGTLDLAMNDANPRVSAIFTFPDIKPCEVLEPIVIKLKNVGQNNGYLYQKIDYVEKDKPEDDWSSFEFSSYNDSSMEMSANKFAALIYVDSIEFLLYINGTPSSQGPRDDMASLLAIDDLYNDDGYCSLYELKQFGWMPYSSDYPEDIGDPDDTLQVGHTATWTIVFHMADSLDPWTLSGAILTGGNAVEDNRPQADGIELTWTAVLNQNPGKPTP